MKILFLFSIFLLFSTAVSSSSNTITTLTPVSFYPTSVAGPLSCTKSTDESFAICTNEENKVIRFNLQPFSFALASASAGQILQSCDLYEEPGNPSASSVVCAIEATGVYFYSASTLASLTTIPVDLGSNPQVIVDKSNATTYVSSNRATPPFIYKIVSINTATPYIAGTLDALGDGDEYPSPLLIIDDTLYVHLRMEPAARMARISILNFTWVSSVVFAQGEEYGGSICNDQNFIYDLISNSLVRLTYNNNNFARVDSLDVFTGTFISTISISPDLSFLIFTARTSGLFIVNTSTFQIESRNFVVNSSTIANLVTAGRPLIMNDNSRVYAFVEMGFNVFSFDVRRDTPRSDVYPVLNPLTPIGSPIVTNSGVQGSSFCTTSSDEKYAVCGSYEFAVRYNLQPFAYFAKSVGQTNLPSCGLYDTGSEATSRVICAKGSTGALFFSVVDMSLITSLATLQSSSTLRIASRL
jgi:hypothetical protein